MSLADYACADEPAHVFAYHADALKFLRSLPDEWVHTIITDPPYGLADHKPDVVAQAITAWATGDRERVPSGKGFMGREWDAFVPPPAVWDECLRVLKPGGHLAVFAGSRTVDLMGLSIRLAGFEMRDGIAAWLYGSGFPKSLDVGKAVDKIGGVHPAWQPLAYAAAVDRSGYTHTDIDRHLGILSSSCYWARADHRAAVPLRSHWVKARDLLGLDDSFAAIGDAVEREIIGTRTDGAGNGSVIGLGTARSMATEFDETTAATHAAREWQGWGTALKPAHEPILLARKPLAGTVAANVLAHRTGAINIDATRVAHASDADRAESEAKNAHADFGSGARTNAVYGQDTKDRPQYDGSAGRWPTNVLLAHHPECGPDEAPEPCVPGCQVAALDEQSGTSTSSDRPRRNTAEAHNRTGSMGKSSADWTTSGHADSGGASRFFPTFRYQAKAPKAERPIVDGTGHPTVKPLGLMRWLVRLLVPGEVDYPDGGGTCGAVLDPFAGSGATLEAARLEGRRAVGIERDEHSVRLIAERLGVPVHLHAAPPVEEPEPEPPPPTPTELLLAKARVAESVDALMELYSHAQAEGLWNDEVRAAFSARKAEVAA